ncbi:MmcQ/YjbR family DNA-binding protein [Maribellus comscasis]|uniref:MmcQ/YjbR family DNA-binding protein n=1 Tax=Maribellus comscasis TaxID=2681766 RepID=A0A6I6JQ89_9BACT|nr:MmcQ/YjbR family DNA-binding protein [Maribellus comscasis]QGY44571.1 MmcQ/YjbR family DNA-binding protein [Maribellus comscasis]
MNIEELREYCLSLKGVSEEFPFGETTLVFKVGGKMFCLTSLEGDLSVSVKNDPEKNIELREEYPAIIPGYHMNKKHWNTISVDGSISDDMIKNFVDESYDLIVMGLTRKQQQELKNS